MKTLIIIAIALLLTACAGTREQIEWDDVPYNYDTDDYACMTITIMEG